MEKSITVIMPILDMELASTLINRKNKVFKDDITELNLTIGTLKKRLKNPMADGGLDNSTYNGLIELGLYTEYNSNDIFGDALKIGELFLNQIIKIEKEHNYYPKGIKHLENILERYEKDIFDNKLVDAFQKMMDKYEYQIDKPFGNYKKTIEFFYRTFELFQIFSADSYTSLYNDNDDKLVLNRYYASVDELMLLDYYLDKYKEYDMVRFYLVKLDRDGENYRMVICTDNVATPIIFELKNTISSFKTGKTYTICKHCHNLFLPTRKGQENCFDKKCKQERDCLYKKN